MQRHICIVWHNHQCFPIFYSMMLSLIFFSLSNEIKCLLFVVVVAASCFYSQIKKSEILNDVDAMV